MSRKIFRGKIEPLVLLATCLLITVNAFSVGDPIRIMVNKISPYTNPTESYLYYDLPYCGPENPQRESQSFGEKLTGNRKTSSAYQASFGIATKKTMACVVELDLEDLNIFRTAIKENFVFDMYIEDAIAGNVVGFIKNNRYYLVNHLGFNIFYNRATGNIIKAQIDYDDINQVVDITESEGPVTVTFTYTVSWGETTIASPVANNGIDTTFKSEAHWLTFLNGITINASLFVIVSLIFQKIQKAADPNLIIDAEAEKKDYDFNWKAIRGEVFRTPVHRILLCSSIGTGIQLALTAIAVLIMGALGMFYQSRGSLIVAAIFVYTAGSFVSGMCSSSMFRYLGGKTWTANLVATFLCFAGPLAIVVTILNNIAWIWQATSALPFGAAVMLIFLFILTLPLTVIGGATGRKREKEKLLEADDKPSAGKRSWTQPSFIFMAAVGGLFSYSVLHFELYSIFAAVWAHKVYTSYAALLLTVVLVISITASISIIFTYYRLNNRDYRWWWKSFLYGGSCGLYVFLYAIYFYRQSNLSGFLQTFFYFGYSALGAFGVSLVLGTAGFVGASAFVKQIYERNKVD